MPESPITFRVPPEVRKAFEAAAKKAGMSVGHWIREAATKALPKHVQQRLPVARKPGRPPKD